MNDLYREYKMQILTRQRNSIDISDHLLTLFKYAI